MTDRLHNTQMVDYYAGLLAQSLTEIKLMDMDKLREFLKVHLEIFFSYALDDSLFDELDKRKDSIINENKSLQIDRAEMEDQMLIAKEKLKNGQRIDMDWFKKCSYAFKIKGIRIQNNCIEAAKISTIQKKNRIAKANNEDRAFRNYMKGYLEHEEFMRIISILKQEPISQTDK